MNVIRGDVVLVDWPFASGGAIKLRPAVVVQRDTDNRRLTNTIVAQVTSRTDRTGIEPTQLFIDISTAEGRQTGLRMNSAVNAANLFTLAQTKIKRVIGRMESKLMQQLDQCLKIALELR